jgi:hypothetical protein
LNATAVPLRAQTTGSQGAADPYVAAVLRAFETKRTEIATTIVGPCKDKANKIAQPAIEHFTTCDCFSNEDERQKALAALRLAAQQSFTKCDLQGLDAQLAYIDQREVAVRAALLDAMRKFEAQSASFALWGKDANSGLKQAQDKIGEILVSGTVGAMVDNIIDVDKEQATQSVEKVIAHAESLRDVRRARTGELYQEVIAMKSELAGTSKAQAKQIILSDLGDTRLAINDVALVEKQVSDAVVKANIPRDEDPSAEEKTNAFLGTEYATLLTGVGVLANHGVKDAKMFSKAAGILAFAPDAIDAAAILYNASAVGDNLSGLEQLRAAAEQQRLGLSAEMTTLVHERQAVSAERTVVERAGGPSGL